jgi:cytochrome c553
MKGEIHDGIHIDVELSEQNIVDLYEAMQHLKKGERNSHNTFSLTKKQADDSIVRVTVTAAIERW